MNARINTHAQYDEYSLVDFLFFSRQYLAVGTSRYFMSYNIQHITKKKPLNIPDLAPG